MGDENKFWAYIFENKYVENYIKLFNIIDVFV